MNYLAHIFLSCNNEDNNEIQLFQDAAYVAFDRAIEMGKEK